MGPHLISDGLRQGFLVLNLGGKQVEMKLEVLKNETILEIAQNL